MYVCCEALHHSNITVVRQASPVIGCECQCMNHRTESAALLLAIAYVGFISLGLPDPLIGVAWPSVRDHFGLAQAAVALVFFGAGCGNFLSSFFTGRLLGVMRIGVLLAASSALVGCAMLGFGFAPVWLMFAACSLFHGLGSGAIDAGLNHYVAHHFSARHMNWLHACYSLGATFGPAIMAAMIIQRGDWRGGYLIVATILLALSVLFAMTHRRWDDPASGDTHPDLPACSATLRETLRHLTVWLQILLFFAYTGLEVTMGQWSFTVLTESRGVDQNAAGFWVTVYWGSIGVGRVLFGFIVERLGVDRLLRMSTMAVLLGALLLMLNPFDGGSAVALALTGLGLAPIYPCMMTRTPQRLGRALSGHAIGFQVGAAMIGAAVLPSGAGWLAQRFGMETIALGAVGMAAVIFVIHEALLRFTSTIAGSAPRAGPANGKASSR